MCTCICSWIHLCGINNPVASFTVNRASFLLSYSDPQLRHFTCTHSVMADTSPSAADYERPTQQTEHPAQQTFTENEQTFLQKYLDDYLVAEPSNNKKGDKKHWVKMHVYYDYITEFKSDEPSGPNLSSLFEVCDMCVPPLTSN
jgi:hypothetical protein